MRSSAAAARGNVYVCGMMQLHHSQSKHTQDMALRCKVTICCTEIVPLVLLAQHRCTAHLRQEVWHRGVHVQARCRQRSPVRRLGRHMAVPVPQAHGSICIPKRKHILVQREAALGDVLQQQAVHVLHLMRKRCQADASIAAQQARQLDVAWLNLQA